MIDDAYLHLHFFDTFLRYLSTLHRHSDRPLLDPENEVSWTLAWGGIVALLLLPLVAVD